MVQAIVSLGEHQNRILNIVKGKFGLKSKSEAINHIIDEYDTNLLESELKPEYKKKLENLSKEPTLVFNNLEEMFQYIEKRSGNIKTRKKIRENQK